MNHRDTELTETEGRKGSPGGILVPAAGDGWPTELRPGCTPGGPKSGKKSKIWKVFFEIGSRQVRISRFGIVRLRVGVGKLRECGVRNSACGMGVISELGFRIRG